MDAEVLDPNAPQERCPKTGLPVYTRRVELAKKLRQAVRADVPGAAGLVIRACGACAGLHAFPANEQTPESGPRRAEATGCRKHRYRTEAEALSVAKYLRAKDEREHRRETRAYRCPECHGCWHLTSRA
jgi:hypothetical protein